MSKYFTAWDNFAVDTIGTDVAGWTERGSTGPNSQAPAYGTPCFKKRYLALKSSSSATPMRSALSWDAIDADANRDDVDMVSAFSYDAATVSQLWLYARGVGGAATAPDECYMGIVDKSTGTNNLIIARRNAATTITTIATASLTLASGKNYLIRFRVNGTALKLRVWDAALGRAGEPSTWNLETTDATYSAAGWVGLGMNNAGVADQVAPFNFLAVGTNGDSAVCPRTNAEYTAWLASQANPSGYYGRTTIMEFLVMTDAVRRLVMQHAGMGEIEAQARAALDVLRAGGVSISTRSQPAAATRARCSSLGS